MEINDDTIRIVTNCIDWTIFEEGCKRTNSLFQKQKSGTMETGSKTKIYLCPHVMELSCKYIDFMIGLYSDEISSGTKRGFCLMISINTRKTRADNAGKTAQL